MPNLTSRVSTELTVRDDAAADATPHGHDREMVYIAPMPKPLLGNRQRIHIVFEVYRKVKVDFQRFSKIHIAPFKKWRVANQSLLRIDQARQSDTDADHAFISNFCNIDSRLNSFNENVLYNGKSMIIAEWRQVVSDYVGIQISNGTCQGPFHHLDSDHVPGFWI